MTDEEIYNQIKDIPGWMPKADCEKLYEYVSPLKNALIVEIGSFAGKSTKLMALSSPSSQIITIDPFIGLPANSDFETPEQVKDEFLKVMQGENYRLIQDLSENVGKTWTKPIDFLHIDGDHHVEAVLKDAKLFVPYVKKGGYVFFHDYSTGGSEADGGRVKEAVDLIIDQYFDEVISDTTLYGFAICRKK